MRQLITAYRKALDPEKSRATFIVSDGSLDRQNCTVNPHGWDLTAYKKNPVVLFAHNYKAIPVARCVAIGVVGESLVATLQFTDITAEAKQIRDYVMGGFLNAASVGFAPLESEGAGKGDPDAYTTHYLRQELLEISMVPVPANAGALIVPGSQKSISKRGKQMRNFRKDDDFAAKTTRWHTYIGRAYPDRTTLYKQWINLQGVNLPDLTETAVRKMLRDCGSLDDYVDIDATLAGQASYKIAVSEKQLKAIALNEFERQDERHLGWDERVMGTASLIARAASLVNPSDAIWMTIKRDAADICRKPYNSHLRGCANCRQLETASEDDFLAAVVDYFK